MTKLLLLLCLFVFSANAVGSQVGSDEALLKKPTAHRNLRFGFQTLSKIFGNGLTTTSTKKLGSKGAVAVAGTTTTTATAAVVSSTATKTVAREGLMTGAETAATQTVKGVTTTAATETAETAATGAAKGMSTAAATDTAVTGTGKGLTTSTTKTAAKTSTGKGLTETGEKSLFWKAGDFFNKHEGKIWSALVAGSIGSIGTEQYYLAKMRENKNKKL